MFSIPIMALALNGCCTSRSFHPPFRFWKVQYSSKGETYLPLFTVFPPFASIFCACAAILAVNSPPVAVVEIFHGHNVDLSHAEVPELYRSLFAFHSFNSLRKRFRRRGNQHWHCGLEVALLKRRHYGHENLPHGLFHRVRNIPFVSRLILAYCSF